MEPPDLNDVARCPARYWTLDGVPELMLGLFWMVWGGAWLFGQTLPRDWRWNTYWLVVPPALAALGLAMNAMIRRLKERVTFPRAGYVAWKEPDRRSRLVVGAVTVAAAVLLAVVVLTGTAGSLEQRGPAVVSVILALSLLAIGVRRRTPHHVVLAGVIVVLALAIGSLTSGWASFNWLLLAAGAASAVLGGVRLARFMRAHPRPAEGM